MGETTSVLFERLERLDSVVHDFMSSVQPDQPDTLERLESEDAQRLQRMLEHATSGHGPVLGPPVLCGASPAIGIECLLGFLGSMRKTGVVRARAGGTEYMISVVRGDVVHGVCAPRPESELLGSLLLARGAIGSEALLRFVETCGSSPSRIVEALNGEELVSTGVLREVLAQQMQKLVDRLVVAESAEWCFHEGEATLCFVNLRVNVNRMLLESARGQDQQGAPAAPVAPGDESATEKKPLALLRPVLPDEPGRHRRRR